MFQREQIREGMVVRSRDGERLGRVSRVEADGFVLEQGMLVQRDYRMTFVDIASIQGDTLVLLRDKDDVHGAWSEEPVAVGAGGQVAAGEFQGGLHLSPRDLEEARMDSAKFQDHGQYDIGTSPDVDEGPGMHRTPSKDGDEKTRF